MRSAPLPTPHPRRKSCVRAWLKLLIKIWCRSCHCPHKKWRWQNSNKRSLGRRNVRLRKLPTIQKELLSDDAMKYLKRCLADPSDVSNQQRSEDDTVNIRRNLVLSIASDQPEIKRLYAGYQQWFFFFRFKKIMTFPWKNLENWNCDVPTDKSEKLCGPPIPKWWPSLPAKKWHVPCNNSKVCLLLRIKSLWKYYFFTLRTNQYFERSNHTSIIVFKTYSLCTLFL